MADLALTLLKKDLQIMTDQLDDYLTTLLSAAAKMIATEGITLTETDDDMILREMYAAYLYRKRMINTNTSFAGAMPRMLRYALNNRLLSEKAQTAEGDPDG